MINGKRRIFIEKYLQCWNATEAARCAGYAHPNTQGPRLLVDVSIKAEIKRRIEEIKVTTDELLTRLAERTRLDMGDFTKYWKIDGDDPLKEIFDLKAAKEDGVSHLIKKIKLTPHGEEVQFHSVDFAIEKLGKNLGLFDDRIEHTGKDGGPIVIKEVEVELPSDDG